MLENDSKVIHYLPDRIIDVGAMSSDTVQLRCASDMEPKERTSHYLTLSHRWPKNHLISLTSKTLASYKHGIPISNLPKTFQHAVQATRQLKQRYLWIDSLCIMQDSVTDWQEQAAKMGSIYMNGLCNLAATAATDSNGGLFFDRNVTTIHPLRVRCHWTFEDFHGLYQHTPGGVCNVDDYLLLNRMIEDTELNTRAWVFQERLLSPRVVHFAQNQVAWECKNGLACEMYPSGASAGPASVANWSHFWPIKNLAYEWSTKSTEAIHADWRRAVHWYSGSSMTKRKDTLPALSGLAKVMQNVTGDKYLAGLWETTIAHDLAWERKGSIKNRPNDSGDTGNWVAPTWSWASSEYLVAWSESPVLSATTIHVTLLRADIVPFCTQKPLQEPIQSKKRSLLTKYLRHRVKYSGHEIEQNIGKAAQSEVTGQLKDAKLHLRGRIFKVPCSKNKRYGAVNPENEVVEVVVSGHTYPAFVTYDDRGTQDMFFVCRDTFPASFGEFEFMPVAYCPIEAFGFHWEGLILESVQDLPDHFRRIGFLVITIPPDQLSEALRSGDRGGEIESFDADLEGLMNFLDLKALADSDGAKHGYERNIILI